MLGYSAFPSLQTGHGSSTRRKRCQDLPHQLAPKITARLADLPSAQTKDKTPEGCHPGGRLEEADPNLLLLSSLHFQAPRAAF